MIKLYIKKGIASVLALLTLATCLSMGSVAFAEDLVAINEQNFPDNAFRGYITDECDLDGNGYLSVSEISSVKSMWLDAFIENEKVSNLDGIDKFYNLEKLYCSDLGLTSLDISKNPKLNTVRASGNELKTITIGSLPNLTVFDCSENGITSLDVSGCPQLSDLKANINKIATLDLSKNKELTKLNVFQNELSELDLSNNIKLVQLRCSSNHIAELDLSANTALQNIATEAIGNQWIELPTKVSDNKITVPKTFADSSRVISTTLDTVVQTEEGEETILAYSNGAFVTDELINISGKLVNANNEVKDGFTYKYNTGNDNCDLMTVNTIVNRNMYQVNFYLDETKNIRLGYQLVETGKSATAPAVPEASSCKKFVSWSEDFSNVTADMDVYIVWADDHNIIRNINTENGDIDIKCTKCDKKTLHFNFNDTYNCFKGDPNYNAEADLNNDGVVNAKDYAIIVNDY
ncbi:leucine-rich repeat domain-containing protein [uncultured Eubacterium sp.]|uniref:leucine-rich repeat domain-containing protein n=1 Tax=uncultured Eubacterium sp. TaxID=165185 RepID=UPI002590123B|nr:hypothetical protein [uncultured Eubacterium sp.]